MAQTLAQLQAALTDVHNQEHALKADTKTAATAAGKAKIAALGQRVVDLNTQIAVLQANPPVSAPAPVKAPAATPAHIVVAATPPPAAKAPPAAPVTAQEKGATDGVARPQLVRYDNNAVKRLAIGDIRPAGYIDVDFLDSSSGTASSDVNITFLDDKGQHTKFVASGAALPYGFILSKAAPAPGAASSSPDMGGSPNTDLITALAAQLAPPPSPTAATGGGVPAISQPAPTVAAQAAAVAAAADVTPSLLSNPYVVIGGGVGAVVVGIVAMMFLFPAPKARK
ncbi:MAG TPA: hypothetical protein VFE58_08995 [Tepidisphaeraceae bacterium]|jgi:hypothetical protein|nr:hypothetical protein [Tepidisphaeraceae bacterium]